MKRLSDAGFCRYLMPLVAAASLLASPAQAGQTVLGSGRIDCVEYLDAEESIKMSIENWVLGFLSFANLRSFNLDLLQHFDNGTLIDAVEDYCRDHPSAQIAEVSATLLKILVASADGDCTNRVAGTSERLSLCRLPGAAEGEGGDVEMVVPAVE